MPAMELLKHMLISTPTLELAYFGGHRMFDTEVCNVLIARSLLGKELDGTAKQIRYWSRSLTVAEKQFDTTQRECLKIGQAILLIRPFQKRYRATIHRYHDALKGMLNLADSIGWLARLRLRL